MEMTTLYMAALVIGLILTVFTLFFDEVFSFEGPLDFSAMMTFLVVFGGTGLILTEKLYIQSDWIFPCAIAVGLLISAVFYFSYIKPMKKAENSMTFSYKEFVGMRGNVITSITFNRYGEVVLQVSGGYVNRIAVSSNGQDILKDAVVVVDKVEDGILFVTEIQKEEED